MTVLVISYRPAQDIVCMGHVVDQSLAMVKAQTFATDEEAAAHVASLNACNEDDAAKYDHYFVYPDGECPGDGIKFSEVCLNISDDYGKTPEHLRALIAQKTIEFDKINKRWKTVSESTINGESVERPVFKTKLIGGLRKLCKS